MGEGCPDAAVLDLREMIPDGRHRIALIRGDLQTADIGLRHFFRSLQR